MGCLYTLLGLAIKGNNAYFCSIINNFMETSLDIRIKKLKEKGYDLSLNKIFDDGFAVWKKIVFLGIFYILFSYLFNNLVNIFISNVTGARVIESEFNEAFTKLSKDPAALQKIVPLFQDYINNPLIVKKTIISFLISLLIFPMNAGVVFCAYQADKKGSASFKDLIRGFQGNKFINLTGLIFIFTIFMIISIFLFFVPVLYFVPAFILAGAFIVIDEAPLLKAIKYSFQVVNMKFGQILLILILSFLISKVLGFLVCGIGLVLTLPFSSAIVYSLYKNTVGTVETTNESDSMTK
ncbi:MAG: hypothetical protein LBP34_06850 [Flavobacteriaceae bacterium]|jgi:hypothetical protein|nr:hypothetical protein [Flavobacteriaceae bacterium]